MSPTAERDFFTDHSILKDPNAYFDDALSRGPVYRSTVQDVILVTGFAEAVAVLKNTDDFSSAIAVMGPVGPLPFALDRERMPEVIAENRGKLPGNSLLVTYDGAAHSNSRSLLNALFVPSRLKANEQFMAAYAAEIVDRAVAKGGCEMIQEIAAPFVTVVVADLLGVPDEDRLRFVEEIAKEPPPGNLDAHEKPANQALIFIGATLYRHLAERRARPCGDLMSQLATATYPDGSTPDLAEVASLATFLFAAGQDTSAKLLGNCLRFLVEDKPLQQHLRERPEALPAFIEEVLRLEGSTKATFRIAKHDTRIGDVAVAAGERVTVLFGAANRDPSRWPDPKAFKLDRPKIKEHLAFGRGAHTCIGAPLARVEVRVLLARLLAATADISLSEEQHGPPGDRRLDYEASYIIRGLEALHLELTARQSAPIDDPRIDRVAA